MRVAEEVRELFRRNPPPGVTAAYLFGSHAEGRAHAESDVDLGVLLAWAAFPTAALRFEERLGSPGGSRASFGSRASTSSC